jgi:hypothetical protein
VSAVLAGVSRPRPPGDSAEDLWCYLDPAFLAGAGWNPKTRTLAPPPGHPLLGYRLCLVQGCAGQGLAPDGLCATCHTSRRRSDLSAEEFIAAGPVRARHCGEVICSAEGCPRPVRTRRLQLCYTHEHRRRQLGLPLAGFLQHPRAQPLPGFGPCKVAVCIRQAHARRGLCRAHDVRWWEQHRAGAAEAADFDAWCRSSAPVASGHEVVMRGVAPLVQAQILFGLQERCRQGALTYLSQLRIICRRLLAVHARTITGFDDSRFARQHRALARDLQQAVLLAGCLRRTSSVRTSGIPSCSVMATAGSSTSPASPSPGSARPSSCERLRNCRPGGVITPRRSCRTTCAGLRSCRAACGCTAMTMATIRGHWAAATSSRSSAGSGISRPRVSCRRGAVRRPAVRSP